jgi:hypothetical protein
MCYTSKSKVLDPEIEIEPDVVLGINGLSWLLVRHLRQFLLKPAQIILIMKFIKLNNTLFFDNFAMILVGQFKVVDK